MVYATDTALSVRPSETYKFLIILSPSTIYFFCITLITIHVYHISSNKLSMI